MVKKIIFTLNLLAIAFLFTSFSFKKEYGVFLGIDNREIEKLNNYQTVVIERQEFDKNDITKLHRSGQKVLAYLNIGAVEKYRSYFKTYSNITLGTYQDWPDERWVDVSQKEWQEFIVNNLAFKACEKGFDGFFIDNTDVYYQYKTEQIYNGLVAILRGLRKYNMKIIINGGDSFITQLINKKQDIGIFDGVNQECVFTSINFKRNTYGRQKGEEHKYFIEYLNLVKNQNKQVYLLEYGANKYLKDKIVEYCKKNNFFYFISKDKSLIQEMEL